MNLEVRSCEETTMRDDKGEGRGGDLGMRNRAIGGMRKLMVGLRRPGGRSHTTEDIERVEKSRSSPRGSQWR